MKLLGIILIVVGIGMFIFRGISYTQEKNVADIGPLEINKKETKTVNWPTYAGVVAVIAGVSMLLLDRKNSTI